LTKKQEVLGICGGVSSDQIAQDLGQHHATIDILLRKARSLMEENLSKMKRLCEAKQFS
jgi:DNA-directed RNA polymerase specialized sigma24 family protein